MADNYNNPQNNWPIAIRRQAESQATGTSGGGGGQAGWVPCCTCRVATISFMLYYLTFNVVILVLVFVNRNKIEDQPRFWWVVSLSGASINLIMSVFVLTAVLFADLTPERGTAEQDKTAKPMEDDRSGSQKTILTINSKPSTVAGTVSANDSSAPPVIDQTTAAAAAAAANQTASQAVKSPSYFHKFSITNPVPNQNFQNLTPNSTSVMQSNHSASNSNRAKKSPKGPKSPNQRRVRSDPVQEAKGKKKVGNKQGARKKS